MDLKVSHIKHSYGHKNVLTDLSFELNAGEIACLLGGSGSGKSTVLRTIAGFERIQSGQISMSGQVLSAAHVHMPAHERQIGMVFQDHALFPHLTVADNIGFGLFKWAKKTREARVQQLLTLIHLEGYDKLFPHELSGGQQQRVALARSLAPRPKLLLLDEPFSSLDVELRERLAREVRDILKSEGVTAIMVTHDQNEAFAVADMVGVMHQGRIEQWDSPYVLYHKPSTRYVADFIGQGVFVRGVVTGKQRICLEWGEFAVPALHMMQEGDVLDVLIRPDDLIHDDKVTSTAVVTSKVFRGTDFMYTLKMPSGQEVLAQVPSHHCHEIGETIGLYLDLEHWNFFPRDKNQ
ncbi:ABC transporter ATP-binding protein [Hydromonas duriensis]|uniref:Iron(III) transport system ATP-binding protein n=1 Tax=Hydromonas duriensis TaxID=1527608 RepID=A0A4R6Y844_9BURK|nr:ABC transporter ATP-binding protein [Hydromonas duriensis]TDR31555.1 iron(III) transport system ATP-binding protein [Hydromonas duriensis]